jgi:transcriptional regulator with GAF, ATPase, and Fis domain
MDHFSLIGSSIAFSKMLSLIEKFAKLRAPVLIEGETGTGKELAARSIHYSGVLRCKPFVPVNCGGFPESLIESELFGHLKGTFTDARTDHPGLVETAAGGTLFLDEIDALAPKAQVALLRFLQDGSYRPIGGRTERKVDVRIIAASNANLDQLVASGAFRSDLLYRLRILTLKLPPLRERGQDSILLARTFFSRCREEHRCTPIELDVSSCNWFDRYLWPGNVRELESTVYREAMISDDELLRLQAPVVFAAERRSAADRRQRQFEGIAYTTAKMNAIEQFDRQYLTELMERAKGNVSFAARTAGKERRSLGKLLKKNGIAASNPGQFRSAN